MKTKLLITIIALGFIATGFRSTEDKKSYGVADQKEGFYIFILSKPLTPYDYLGSEKKSIAWTGKPEEMLNSMIRKVKSDYPKADAIIFTTISMDRADAVKFKE
ncbi:MAG: hypothetical protein ACHQRM_14365 [Bacteroidia bacterium]